MNTDSDMKQLELGIKAQELEVKKAEERNKAWELYNAHARDTRLQADGLMKSILLLSGGALTLSIGAFLRPEPPLISPECLALLRWSWGLLITSMVLAVAVVFIGVLASDMHSKRWLSWLKNNRPGELSQPQATRYILWTTGSTALLAHWIGLGLLAFIAIQIVS